jgi:adenylate kinase
MTQQAWDGGTAVNLIMIGAPGAGKGTQAERVARERGVPKISTGDMLREAIHQGTELGLRAKTIVERGDLVSDDVMIGVVRERLERPDARRGFVLDGFPRTVPQAQALDDMVADRGPLLVVEVVVPEAELERRMSARRICRTCGANAPPDGTACGRCGGELVLRADDGEAAVRIRRLGVYERQTGPIVEFYRHRPTFRSINGAQSPDEVARALSAAIDSAMERSSR